VDHQSDRRKDGRADAQTYDRNSGRLTTRAKNRHRCKAHFSTDPAAHAWHSIVDILRCRAIQSDEMRYRHLSCSLFC